MPDGVEVIIAVDGRGRPVPYESDQWVRAELVQTHPDGEVERIYLLRDQPEEAPSG